MREQIKAIAQVKEVSGMISGIISCVEVVPDQSLGIVAGLGFFKGLRDGLNKAADKALDEAISGEAVDFELASLELSVAINEVNGILLGMIQDPKDESFNQMAIGWLQSLKEANAVLLQTTPVPTVIEPEPKPIELTVLANSNPSYKILVQRCAGDSAQADRLIRYEQEKDRSQSYAQATRAAISRFERDRCAV